MYTSRNIIIEFLCITNKSRSGEGCVYFVLVRLIFLVQAQASRNKAVITTAFIINSHWSRVRTYPLLFRYFQLSYQHFLYVCYRKLAKLIRPLCGHMATTQATFALSRRQFIASIIVRGKTICKYTSNIIKYDNFLCKCSCFRRFRKKIWYLIDSTRKFRPNR